MIRSDDHKRDRVLITGGTGLVGSHILLRFVSENIPVWATYRSEPSKEKTLHVFRLYDKADLFDRISWIKGDITFPGFADDLAGDIEAVIHAAGYVSFNPRKRDRMLQTNYEGTANLVNTALTYGIPYFVYLSSIAALGGQSHRHTEKDIWSWTKPHTPYAASKFLGETEVWRGMEEGLKAVIVNPSVVIGPGFWNYGIGEIFRKIYQGKLRYFFPGITGYVDVRDVAEIVFRLYERRISSERFILNEGDYAFGFILEKIARCLHVRPPSRTLGKGLLKSLVALINIPGKLTGKGPLVDPVALESLYDEDYYDASKIKNVLSYNFIPIDESICFTAEKFKKDFEGK